MRIRKNAKLSSLIFSHASGTEQPLQSHVCQLNQSPWDVIPFSQDSTYPSPQFQGEDSFNGNVSLGDSIGAVESNSFPSLMEDSDEVKVDKMLIDDNSEEEEMKIESFNNKSTGETKGMHWGKEKKKLGRPTTSKKSAAGAAVVAPSGRRGRGKAARRGGTTSNSAANPYEFYYYSGFGPLWGKRRGGGGGGGRRGEIMNNNNKRAEIDTTSSSVDHLEEVDFLDDEDSDDNESDRELGGKKKRMRKPVKARSLKSLM